MGDGRRYRFLILLVLLLAVAALAAIGDAWRWWHAPLARLEDPVVVEIDRGSSLRRVLDTLEQSKVIDRLLYFETLVRLHGAGQRLQAGEYRIEPDWSPSDLMTALVNGRVLQHPFTLIEGWTFQQLRAALMADPTLDGDLDAVSDAELMDGLGMPGMHPEGWFFPDTYFHTRGHDRLRVLERAHARMQTELESAWQRRQGDLPFDTRYEGLILASMIERETGLDGERRKVAGVLVRRLREGMRLQTDPTVIYGMGDAYQGRIRRSDLRRDTPYNTYTRYGLTPTPIAMPGRDALRAAFDPDEGEALYFVSRGDGSHHFSATLDEHNAAVRRYILGER